MLDIKTKTLGNTLFICLINDNEKFVTLLFICYHYNVRIFTKMIIFKSYNILSVKPLFNFTLLI